MIIALDFDGTLCDHEFPEIGKPRMWLIEKAIEWRKLGHHVILWTCREDVPENSSSLFPRGNYLTQAIEFCKQFGLEFDAVNSHLEENTSPGVTFSRKIFANIYIDDKAACFDDLNQRIVFNHLTCQHGLFL